MVFGMVGREDSSSQCTARLAVLTLFPFIMVPIALPGRLDRDHDAL
jgi:hypothetical protein